MKTSSPIFEIALAPSASGILMYDVSPVEGWKIAASASLSCAVVWTIRASMPASGSRTTAIAVSA